MRASSLLIIASSALLATACGTQTTTSRSPNPVPARPPTATHPRTSSSTATSSTAMPTTVTHTTSPPPLQVLRTFAAAYGAYLDGRVPATTLPDATATARAQVGPPIPAARRAGTLALVAVAQIAGGPSYIVTLRDHAHTFGTQLTLTTTTAGSVVSTVSPPDLDTILGPPARAIPSPAGSAGAHHAASAFIGGYLAWLYGHGPADAITDATPSLLARLEANPPNIPPPFRSRYAHVVAVGLKAEPHAHAAWLAYVSVNDSEQTYDLTLTVISAQGRWLVAKVRSPQ
jgi:hypothetical protein